MAATALTERYAPNLHGVLSCYDRVIVTGTLPGACYAGGMTSFLYSRGIRIFDYPWDRSDPSDLSAKEPTCHSITSCMPCCSSPS